MKIPTTYMESTKYELELIKLKPNLRKFLIYCNIKYEYLECSEFYIISWRQ